MTTSTTIHHRQKRTSWILGALVFSIRSCSGLFFDQSVVIDPNDPLENTGPSTVITEPVQFALETDTLQGEMFIPRESDGSFTEIYGFVLFMPGAGSSFTMYEDYLNHLASHGYLTVGLDFASRGITTESEHDLKAQQALDVIAAVQSMDSAYESLPVICAGHSQGGKISFYAASTDTTGSIKGVMAMDPVNSGGPPCFLFPNLCIKYPVAPNTESGQRGIMHQMSDGTGSIIFRSEPDFFTNPDEQFNAQYFYYGSDGQGTDAAPSPAFYYDMGNFGHTAYLPMLCSEQIQLIKRSMVAFLQQHIQGIGRDDYLTGNIVQADIDSGYLNAVESR
ncbi:expressed unknown protein [Seminavis robusta]|uniref:Serine aminopeptidase S33 domain-containing protein n=1 Tax=Seminavis robusta TaxID=568900 RepID=A0A9N8EP22_9STRA|nr:expressed unknown protein [Seminavis robusta]|eukprot:Sro1667_g289770.1 n/a (335) ;mRNA; f:5229-6233